MDARAVVLGDPWRETFLHSAGPWQATLDGPVVQDGPSRVTFFHWQETSDGPEVPVDPRQETFFRWQETLDGPEVQVDPRQETFFRLVAP